MPEDKNQRPPADAARGGREMSEAEVDRNLLDTFPASDPPSWTLGTDHQRESTPPADERPEPTSD